MIKHFSITISFAFILCSSPAQFDTSFAKTHIRHCADSLVSGFKTKNWELFARYSYPALIGAMGGKDQFKKTFAMMFDPIPDSSWKQYEPGKILQVIKTGGDLQTIIELKMKLEWQGKLISSVTYLIGESWDGGLFWTFFDSEGDRGNAMLVKPDLNEQLIIPKKIENIEPIQKTKNNP